MASPWGVPHGAELDEQSMKTSCFLGLKSFVNAFLFYHKGYQVLELLIMLVIGAKICI